MTQRRFSIFMFMNLFKQMDSWLLAVEGLKHEQKQKLTRALNANKSFLQDLEADLEKNGMLDQFYEDGECFSRILELIKKAKTVQEKQELFFICQSYTKGELTIKEEETI